QGAELFSRRRTSGKRNREKPRLLPVAHLARRHLFPRRQVSELRDSNEEGGCPDASRRTQPIYPRNVVRVAQAQRLGATRVGEACRGESAECALHLLDRTPGLRCFAVSSGHRGSSEGSPAGSGF